MSIFYKELLIVDKKEKKARKIQFKKGINYGNAYTGNYIASKIYNLPEYEKQFKRIIIHNSIVFVGNGPIPIH